MWIICYSQSSEIHASTSAPLSFLTVFSHTLRGFVQGGGLWGVWLHSATLRDTMNYLLLKVATPSIKDHKARLGRWVSPCFTRSPVEGGAWCSALVGMVWIQIYCRVEVCMFWSFMPIENVMNSPLPSPDLFSKNAALLKILWGHSEESVSKMYWWWQHLLSPVWQIQAGLKLYALYTYLSPPYVLPTSIETEFGRALWS